MSIGGFFKSIWRGIRKVLPFLKGALDNDVIRLILVSKFGQKIVDIITALVRLADEMPDASNAARHAFVFNEARTKPEVMAAGMSDSDLDIQIKMAVKDVRGDGSLQAVRDG